jgi:hypothetical protein
MVTKELINSYGMSSVDDYFLYILESKDNGQHKQARQLYNDLSERQREYFWDFVETSFFYEAKDSYLNDTDGEATEMETLKQYFKSKK